MNTFEFVHNLSDTLDKYKAMNEVLWQLYHHHKSQSKAHVPPVSKDYHKELCLKIKPLITDEPKGYETQWTRYSKT